VSGSNVALVPSFIGCQPCVYTDTAGNTIRPLGDIEAAQAAGAAALNVLASPLLHGNRHAIIVRTAALRLPAVYQWPETAEEGGLLAYGPRFSEFLRQWARQLAKVLRGAKPDLVIARISGYGQTGPKSPLPGFGTLAEAMSGFAYTNGWPDKPPTLPSFALADATAGLTAAYGVLAALRHRDRTGEGQDVDVALYEPLLTMRGSIVLDYQQLGIVQQRAGNVVPFTAPRNAPVRR